MKAFVIAILVLLLVLLCAAQESNTSTSKKSRPDLSGRWMLEFSEDSKGKTIKMIEEIVLVVKHQEPEVKFLENAGGEKEQELNYYTDGRGEENLPEISIHTGQGGDSGQFDQKLKSKTKWDGEKLVSRANLQRTVNGHLYRMELVKEWKLSKDGNALTLTSRTSNLNPNSGTRSPSSGAGILLRNMTSETKKVYRRDSVAPTK